MIELSSIRFEKLAQIRKRLHFDRISGRVTEEHRGLLTRLTGKAHVRFDFEGDLGISQPCCQSPPVIHGKDDAEMRHRNTVTINRVAPGIASSTLCQMRDDLMAVEIEVDPGIGAATFPATDHAAPKSPGSGQVIDRECEVKGTQRHLAAFRASQQPTEQLAFGDGNACA